MFEFMKMYNVKKIIIYILYKNIYFQNLGNSKTAQKKEKVVFKILS